MNPGADSQTPLRRVAFFGGRFDPPHLGHLAVARAARTALDLDAVLFAPVGVQPLKGRGATAGYQDRVAMTKLAITGEPGFELSLADAPTASGAPNYSLDTLESLRSQLAGCALFFLMGADAFFGLRLWRRAAQIPFVAPLIVASRPGQRLGNIRAALPEGLTLEAADEDSGERGHKDVCAFLVRNQAGETADFYLLPGLDVPISASDIRARIQAEPFPGRPLVSHPDLLPQPVLEYIRTHGLYR